MIADFHNDVLTEKDLPVDKYLKGLDIGVLALYKGDRNFNELFEIANKYTGKHKIAFEDIGGITNAQLDKLITFSPIYVTLTWNHKNDLACGCNSSGNLSKRGKQIIKVLTQNNIYIDTAHLCKKSFIQILDVTHKTINSHTCFKTIHDHIRNIDDEQIKLLNSRKSLIGITFVANFLTSKNATSCDVVKQIDYFVQKYGANNLCFGSDFFGTKNLPVDINSYNDLKKIEEKLVKLGYKERDINNIFYNNLSNFLNA